MRCGLERRHCSASCTRTRPGATARSASRSSSTSTAAAASTSSRSPTTRSGPTTTRATGQGPATSTRGTTLAYLDAIRDEAERARAEYDLLLLPGLELTYDDVDPALAAHAVAVGLDRFVGVDLGIDVALERARAAGAALIAAHPYTRGQAEGARRRTARFACEWRELRLFVDRFELFNRHEFFGWVAEAGLPAVASGDFHRLEHLATWKTMVPCEKHSEAVIEYLRSIRPTYLVQLGAPVEERNTRAA